MTGTVTTVTRSIIESTPYGTLSTTVGLVAILLLVVLLVQQELLRSAGTPRTRPGERALTIAIAPLLLASAVIMAVRLASLWLSP